MYVTLLVAGLAATSVAFTVKVRDPNVEVSTGLPFGTVPTQLATPEVASAHE